MKSFELVEKKSRFIGLKFDLNSLEDVKKIIESVRIEHKKARHVCYAYVYNREVVSEKCSDDG